MQVKIPDLDLLEGARNALEQLPTRNHAGLYIEALMMCESEDLIDDDRFLNGLHETVKALYKPDEFEQFTDKVARLLLVEEFEQPDQINTDDEAQALQSLIRMAREITGGKPAPDPHRLDYRKLSTVLAALRFWQREGWVSGGHEHEIASSGGGIKPLTKEEIDALCERINCGG